MGMSWVVDEAKERIANGCGSSGLRLLQDPSPSPTSGKVWGVHLSLRWGEKRIECREKYDGS